MKPTAAPETSPAALSAEREALIERYLTVRSFTEELCAPLHPEDMVVQTVVEVSPTKWHLAHTSWFFETFILGKAIPHYKNPVPEYAYLFNSYYQAAGPMHCRSQRGVISRPTVDQVMDYRKQVDRGMLHFMRTADEQTFQRWRVRITIGLHHEQQHQELMVTDIKHVFAQNPMFPVYQLNTVPRGQPGKQGWVAYEGGVQEIGQDDDNSFFYDNERPRHKVYAQPFALADRLVTNREFLEFVGDGGYERPEFWLSLGWMTVQEQGWQAPLYWQQEGSDWKVFTLSGLRDLDPDEPVCHVSLFEAAAYARWAGARLPEEHEWEIAARRQEIQGNFVENRHFHPTPVQEDAPGPLRQVFGDVWEWTRTSYAPYPGYEAAFSALGEYNGKFMCNQYVLRGGSCATAESHIRATYRNFFQPDKRWQFTGIRLAKDA
ncbi:MAG: hypothetical protein E1N59_987 [Puniceicoccaceae bacterium 5H]|nr:MAG: hypothetical protein E1N59_987 [Puniceicoccaceae bacterium 5H]